MLPIWTTVKQSYGWVKDHPRLLAPPMAILLAVQFLQEVLSVRLAPDAWARIAATFLLLIVDGAFSVGLFRAVILDEARRGLAFLRWGFELWRYLKTVLIATIGVLILGLAVLMAAGAGFRDTDFHSWKVILIGVLVALPLLCLAARLLLAFPAAALGQDKVFRLSWKRSKGNALRLLAVLFLTTLVPTLAESLLDFAAASTGPLALPAALLSSAIEVLDTALITTALSLSYRLSAPAPVPADHP
jgi:hypothetical protein